ncbi:MAG: hypothetical protein WBV73_03060 [Phormidium sp.]
MAIALVGSLALYQQTALTESIVLKQRRWRAAATNNPIAGRNLHCENKIIISRPDGMDREEPGEKMCHCWQKFFRNNKI